MQKVKDKAFEDVESMSKEEAIAEIKKHFKGNRRFIDQATLLIYSSHDFIKLNSFTFEVNSWNWQKYMLVSFSTKSGFKMLFSRKGNKRYARSSDRVRGNVTSDIDESKVVIYYKETDKSEEHTW